MALVKTAFVSPPPRVTTDEGRALLEWAANEFLALARRLEEATSLELRPIYGEPLLPREGMIVYADGTVWDPGSGKGVYNYDGASWVPLF